MPRAWLPAVLVSMTLCLPAATPAGQPTGQSDPGPVTVGPDDWPWWRGPNRDGVADPRQKPPLEWGEGKNVLWQAPVPGRGHGSPTVVGDQVFLAAAEPDRQVQSVLCFDRRTGKQLWHTEVHRGEFDHKGNARSTLASSTVACDGRRLFINFFHGGGIWTTALDRDGKILWQTKVSDFISHQGFGSSPAVYENLVLVTADHKGGGAVAALDRGTGAVVWKRARPATANYASPIVLTAAGREQLILTGCDVVTGLDPRTGKELWEVPGSTTETVTSTVTDGQRVVTSGGYPKNHVSAVLADGSGKLAWEKTTRIYVPSLLCRDGHLYGVTDAGVAFCWRSDTGKEVWEERLGEGCSASPVLVGGLIFATSERGTTFVYKASPAGFEFVAENKLGDEAFATPTFCGNRVYLRVASTRGGQRQETLYCVGRE